MAPDNKAGSAEIADTTAKNGAITTYLTARRVRAKLAGRTKRRHLPPAVASPYRRNMLAIFFASKVEEFCLDHELCAALQGITSTV